MADAVGFPLSVKNGQVHSTICGTLTEPEFACYAENAIRWASARVGLKEYRFRCLAFVEDAYEKSNSIDIFGGSTAKESADGYEAANHAGPPEPGAYVFYDSFGTLNNDYKNWGHVGLHVGEGVVIHAWNRIRSDDYLELQSLIPAPGWTKLQYIGWAPVKRILRDCRRR
jgi:hypothetical protein